MFPVIGASATTTAAVHARPPINVAACRVSTPVADLHMGRDIGTTYVGNYALHVRFSDASEQPIKRVVFTLNNGRRVVDTGTFSPGVTIRQTLDLSPTNGDACSVRSVTLANGMRWSTQTTPTG
jgi:hypothetical protein